MVVLGLGVVAMEMAQAFVTFGLNMMVVLSGRSGKLLPGANDDGVDVLRGALEANSVAFVTSMTVQEVRTLCCSPTMGGGGGGEDTQLPLMRISLATCNANPASNLKIVWVI